jgi:putative DNA primase/helicase
MDAIDARPLLVGTKSRVFDIEKGKHSRLKSGTFVTKRTTVDPDFDGQPRRWLKFLNQICQRDEELVQFVQRWCGYLLTGSVKEHALLILYGPGGNGKSVLVNTVATIMGSYHKEAAPATFMESKTVKHETDMAYIAGARFVTSGEPEQESGWNEGTMKRAVAGDPVTARFLYKNPFTYRPTYKIWVATNHLPRLRSVGPAMRRRIHLLEFNFVPKSPDPDLEEKLAEEHGVILAWMLNGAKAWLKQGLNPPAGIVASTNEYFAEQDTLGTWLAQNTRVIEGAKTPSAILCESYNRFLRARNLPEVHASVFGRQLSSRGFLSKLDRTHRGGERVRCFEGVMIRSNT